MQAGWTALPLRGWLAEDRGEPEALAFCRPPDCSPGLVVSVFRLRGRDADEAQAVLRAPDVLVRALTEPGEKPRKVETEASVAPVLEGAHRGFALSLGPKDGSKSPAFAEAFGRRVGRELEVVLVIGQSADAVDAAARKVVRASFGS